MFSLVQNLTSALRAHEAKNIFGHDRKGSENSKQSSAYPQDQKDDVKTDDGNYDGSELSVQSLIWFFEDYLESRLDKEDKKSKEKISDGFKPWMKNTYSNSNDDSHSPRKVAGLYGKNHDIFTDSASVSYIGDDDIRRELKDVYFLIQDLRILRDNGVQNLMITYDQPFISGVIGAVAQFKAVS